MPDRPAGGVADRAAPRRLQVGVRQGTAESPGVARATAPARERGPTSLPGYRGSRARACGDTPGVAEAPSRLGSSCGGAPNPAPRAPPLPLGHGRGFGDRLFRVGEVGFLALAPPGTWILESDLAVERKTGLRAWTQPNRCAFECQMGLLPTLPPLSLSSAPRSSHLSPPHRTPPDLPPVLTLNPEAHRGALEPGQGPRALCTLQKARQPASLSLGRERQLRTSEARSSYLVTPRLGKRRPLTLPLPGVTGDPDNGGRQFNEV